MNERWTADDEYIFRLDDNGQVGDIVAKVALEVGWYVTDNDKANARLIAAAPQLLEACKAFVEAWEKPYQLEKMDVAHRKAIEAIAAAEGTDQ